MADNKQQTEREIKYSGENVPTYYANNVETAGTPWDFRFRFGQIEKADASELLIKNVAVVYMSIDHARLFFDRLGEAIAGWDRNSAAAKAQHDDSAD